MKVLLVNGSPHKEGCTHGALVEIAKTLKEEDIDSEIFWIGKEPFHSCIACWACVELKKCVFEDSVNEFLEKAKEYQGYFFGTPVHWAGATGSLISFLDRVCCASYASKSDSLYLKPAAAIVSARRGGASATYDQLNKYFGFLQMPIVSSQYWNMVHAMEPEELEQDQEGLQTMRVLARNMAYLLRCQNAAKELGVPLPQQEERILTNFCRIL